MSKKCKLGDDNSYIVTIYSLNYVRLNYYILFICLLCIETYWHGNAPPLVLLCNIKCKFEPLYTTPPLSLFHN